MTERCRASLVLYALASAVGLAALAWPLLGPAVAAATGVPAAPSSPMLLSLLVAFSLAALLFESGSAGLGPRAIAVLGVLVATNSVLRFAEVALPGPGGFSPIFVLIILAGYAYGPRFGFLLGTLTLALSAIVTGGVGPWLPYQMLAAGWVGLTAGWLPARPGSGGAAGRPEIWILSVFSAAWGLLYGAIMTLWFWPYLESGTPAPLSGVGGQAVAQRFLAFYLASSLPWDVFRAAGNALLVLAVGAPVLGALRRFGRRFRFTVVPGTASSGGTYPTALVKHSLSARNDLERTPLCPDGTPAIDAPATADGAGVNPHAWAAWLLAVTALASATRNPLVLGALMAAVLLVRSSLPRHPERESLPLGRFAALVVPLAALYSFLTAHAGATVVVRLPSSWPVVGGPLTVESLVFGLLAGSVLVLLLAAFGVFRRALSARSLVRLIPRAFGALSLVGAIALTYVPSVLEQLRAVREAQAIRGHSPRGIRDAVPLAVPLLVGGMERSMHLGESMAARGLAAADAPSPAGRLAFGGGLAAVAAGWLGRSLDVVPGIVGAGAILLGAGLALGAVVALGRRSPVTSFRHTPWRATDTVIAAAAWLPFAVARLSPPAQADLAYSPYPMLSWPTIAPVLALSLLGMAAPALLRLLGRRPVHPIPTADAPAHDPPCSSPQAPQGAS